MPDTQYGIGGNSPQPASAGFNKGPSPENLLRNTPDGGALISGVIYEGVITDVNPSLGVASVTLGQGAIVTNCLFASNIISPLIGFHASFFIPVGSNVLLLYKSNANSYVIGGVPTVLQNRGSYLVEEGAPGFKGREALSAYEVGDKDNTLTALGAAFPTDMLEGELDLSNTMGSVIAFLLNVIKLSSSDRAKVETCLLNGMVRIVSDYFVHHSSAGDSMIYDDGRLNVVEQYTSYSHEADGKLTAEDSFADVEGGVIDMSSISPNDTGRWRYTKYLGFLGDFIHEIITDPEDAIGKYAAGNIKSGKVQQYVGSDGTLLFRAVGEIALERVCRIVKPIQIGKWDDPENPMKKEYDALDAKFLRVWEAWKDREGLVQTAWQLREYARYLSCFFSYKRFLQLEKEGKMKIPTETSTPFPQWNCKEEDKATAMAGFIASYDTYACIRIMRDGSIVLLDGSASSVVMNQGNIQVSCQGNLELSAGGNLSLTGKNVSVKAANHIELAAISGSLKASSRTGTQVYSELGSIWLRTDMSDENEDMAEGNQVFSEEEAPAPMRLGSGILLDSPKEGIQALCMKDIKVKSSKESLQVQVQKDITVKSATGNVSLSGMDVVINSQKGFSVLARTVETTANTVNLGSLLQLSTGKANFSGSIECARMSAFGVIKGPKNPRNGHENHIMSLGDDEKQTAMDKVDITPPEDPDIEEPEAQFTFEEFPVGKSEEDPDALHLTMTADIITYNPTMREKAVRWDFQKNRLLFMGTAPYPGLSAQVVKYDYASSDTLDKPMGKAYSSIADILGSATKMTMTTPYMYARK